MHFNLSRRAAMSSIAATAFLAATTSARAGDPKAIADQVFRIYIDTLERSSAVLKGAPEPTPDLAASLDSIKDEAITELVALGHEIAAMGAEDRAAVESALSMSIASIDRMPDSQQAYKDYQAAWGAYYKGDKAFFERIKSLNILTQYAFFDLLRKQEPEEADRLGV